MYRGRLVRERLKRTGHGSNQEPAVVDNNEKPLANVNVVLAGTVPKFQGKKTTHAELGRRIVACGGRVRNSLPGKAKGRSTKKYILLYNANGKTKVPAAVRQAVRLGFPVSYDFLFDSLSLGRLTATAQYIQKLTETNRVMKAPSLKRHLSNRKRFISLLKGKRSFATGKKDKMLCHRNPAVLYAKERLTADIKQSKVAFKRCGRIFISYVQKYRHLSESMRDFYRRKWLLIKQLNERTTTLLFMLTDSSQELGFTCHNEQGDFCYWPFSGKCNVLTIHLTIRLSGAYLCYYLNHHWFS